MLAHKDTASFEFSRQHSTVCRKLFTWEIGPKKAKKRPGPAEKEKIQGIFWPDQNRHIQKSSCDSAVEPAVEPAVGQAITD
jgi:hypothetical protein